MLIWKVRVEVPPTGMLAGENDLLIVAGLATVSVAVLLVVPVPPLLEPTAPVMLFLTPLVVPFTLTESVHETPAAIVPPVRLTNELPPVVENVPPQLSTAFGVLATTTPAGRESLKATAVSATVEFGLAMVKVSVEVPFTGTLAGAKLLLMTGGATTVMLAEAVRPVPPWVEVMALVVLFLTPAVVPFTFTLKVQEPLVAKLAPDKVITLVFCVAVMVPLPQLPVRPLGVEITKPAGSVSLKPIALSEVVVFGF